MVRRTPRNNQLLSGEDLARMSDPGPCELVEGRIVPMSPTSPEHGRLEFLIAHRLGGFVEASDRGHVMTGEVGIYTGHDPDTVRAADVAFISHERYARRGPRTFLDVAPELAVEILSPDDAWSEVTAKVEEYCSAGVDVVWVVDPRTRSVHAYRSLGQADVFGPGDTLTAPDILPGFAVAVAKLFV